MFKEKTYHFLNSQMAMRKAERRVTAVTMMAAMAVLSRLSAPRSIAAGRGVVVSVGRGVTVVAAHASSAEKRLYKTRISGLLIRHEKI